MASLRVPTPIVDRMIPSGINEIQFFKLFKHRYIMLLINDLTRQDETLSEKIMGAAQRVLSSGYFVLGSEVESFELLFARYCGVEHCVSTGNGTDALELAMRALDLPAQSGIALVANAGFYSSIAALGADLQPVYVDVDDDSLLMDLEALARVPAASIKVVVATHLFGRMLDMDRLTKLCQQRGWFLIEDCAQSHGAKGADGRMAGSYGDLAAFSFYPTKNLGAAGDGGAVVTASTPLAQRLKSLRQYGWGKKYEVLNAGGRNSRLDALQAAILVEKLPYLDQWNQQRRDIARRYSEQITNPLVRLPQVSGDDYVAHLFVVRVHQRDALAQHLRQHLIATDVHYPIPDHRQPVCSAEFSGIHLPVTEAAAQTVLTLPCFPTLSDSEVNRVAQIINDWNGQ